MSLVEWAQWTWERLTREVYGRMPEEMDPRGSDMLRNLCACIALTDALRWRP